MKENVDQNKMFQRKICQRFILQRWSCFLLFQLGKKKTKNKADAAVLASLRMASWEVGSVHCYPGWSRGWSVVRASSGWYPPHTLDSPQLWVCTLQLLCLSTDHLSLNHGVNVRR